MIAEFKLWKWVQKPKAVIVLTPPSQSDGRRVVDEPDWQEFATKHKVALVGCFFQDDYISGIEQYADAFDSGWALLKFLQKSLGVNAYKDLPPILLWGFSAGGEFNYEFARHYPERVAGFVVNKGGVYYTALCPENTRKVPGLFIIGQQDSQWRKDIVRGIYGLNKVAGAPEWHLVEEKGVAHAVADSEALGREFFKGILGRMK